MGKIQDAPVSKTVWYDVLLLCDKFTLLSSEAQFDQSVAQIQPVVVRNNIYLLDKTFHQIANSSHE